MKNSPLAIILTSTLLLMSSCGDKSSRQDANSEKESSTLPSGWHKGGDKSENYAMALVEIPGPNGSKVATIRSLESHNSGFGTLMQNSRPDLFLGKRVRMSGFLKTRDASSARFWLRVDKAGTSEPLSFDNMDNRPVTGTTDWAKYSIVLDVPEAATNIAYGALLAGTGEVWFDNLSFEVVDSTTQTTGSFNTGQLQKHDRPFNLDFEK